MMNRFFCFLFVWTIVSVVQMNATTHTIVGSSAVTLDAGIKWEQSKTHALPNVPLTSFSIEVTKNMATAVDAPGRGVELNYIDQASTTTQMLKITEGSLERYTYKSFSGDFPSGAVGGSITVYKNGSYQRIYRNLIVTQARFLRFKDDAATTKSVSFPDTRVGITASKTVSLDYSDVLVNASITGANAACFSVDEASFGNNSGAYEPNKTYTIKYTPTEEDNHSATLTLTAANGDVLTINLSGKGVQEYDATFYVDGVQQGEAITRQTGATYALPAVDMDMWADGNFPTFYGWSLMEVAYNASSAAIVTTSPITMEAVDVNYYAVFTDGHGHYTTKQYVSLAAGTDVNVYEGQHFTFSENVTLADVVVMNNASLSVAGGNASFANLTVKPAGKLVVTAPVVVTNDFILEGGLYNGVSSYSMPNAQIQKPMTVAAGHFKLKYTVDFTRFYFVSLPNDVDVANVTMEGEAMGVHPLFYKYDSQNRALNGKQNNWKIKSVDGTGTLEAGKGYIFSLEPSSTTATAVFPLDETLISGTNGNNIETSVSVEDFDGAGVSVYNKGWNLVGANGRIGAISSIDAALGVVRYVSIPHALDDSYDQVELSDGFEIPAFSSFFVQVKEDNTLTFPVAAALAPRRIAEETDERMARITLTSGDGDSDHMGVLVTEEATTDYNVGLDLTKMYGSSQKTLCYTLIGANKLAYNALPQVAASNIPVGYKTSLAGEYAFALKENSREGFLHVWLSDTEENTTVDLLEGAYVFTTEATTNNTRFLLSCVTDAPTIATDVETVATQSWLATEGHVIHVFGVAENALVSVYDAAGRMVQQMHVNGEDANFVVSGEGLYVVRVQTNNATTSLKAMVK